MSDGEPDNPPGFIHPGHRRLNRFESKDPHGRHWRLHAEPGPGDVSANAGAPMAATSSGCRDEIAPPQHGGLFAVTVDLFASAMGAFIVISIIMMPDYQKEVRSQGDLEYLEQLAGQTEALLQETEEGQRELLEALLAAQTRHQQLQADYEIVSSELQTLEAEQQARNDQPPPPPPGPVVTPEEEGSNLVTFRFLGLKTERRRICFWWT
jgi:hypothetical protein